MLGRRARPTESLVGDCSVKRRCVLVGELVARGVSNSQDPEGHSPVNLTVLYILHSGGSVVLEF
jgi:hypothetical protein